MLRIFMLIILFGFLVGCEKKEEEPLWKSTPPTKKVLEQVRFQKEQMKEIIELLKSYNGDCEALKEKIWKRCEQTKLARAAYKLDAEKMLEFEIKQTWALWEAERKPLIKEWKTAKENVIKAGCDLGMTSC